MRHEKYGEGVVKKIIPMENQSIVLTVIFETVGKRLLDPGLAKLERIEG